jgi:hypothetical protein
MEHYYLITVESQKLALEILEQAQENNVRESSFQTY